MAHHSRCPRRVDNIVARLQRRDVKRRVFFYVKTIVFLLLWAYIAVFLIVKEPFEPDEVILPLEPQKLTVLPVLEKPLGNFVRIILKGNIDVIKTRTPTAASKKDLYVAVYLRTYDPDKSSTAWKSQEWKVYIRRKWKKNTVVKHDFWIPWASDQWKTDLYEARNLTIRGQRKRDPELFQQLLFHNLHYKLIGFTMTIIPNPLEPLIGIIYGLLLVLMLYTLSVFEIFSLAVASMLTAATAIAMLSMMELRPTFHRIINWIDMETLMLIFGMMVMVSIIMDTGIFDYLSVYAYQLSRGNICHLFFYLCMFTGLFSAILDNISIVMLVAPVAIRLGEILNLNIRLLLISIAIFSNLGGAMTPVGDPTTMVIISNSFVAHEGITFDKFTMHMVPGVIASMLLTFLLIYAFGRNRFQRSPSKIYDRTLSMLEMRKEPEFKATLDYMKAKYPIKDWILLIKCTICLGMTGFLFVLSSMPFMPNPKMCWIALLGAMLMMILTNRTDNDSLLTSVQWSTLISFAAVFIVIESLVEMGIDDWLGDMIIMAVLAADKSQYMTVSILLVLWITAIASAFLDDVPIATLMLKVSIRMAANRKIHLPISPLIWALTYGLCFGGNGTSLGASSNGAMIAIASQFGYPISFMQFTSISLPLMIASILVAMIYLLIAHSVFHWH
ncbi:hypothetical protein KR044_005504 [Drosophila immigrans]|nr:hypothetical protein KR044_005504 [Drosophila immigrans]